jgi:hypothetical protein
LARDRSPYIRFALMVRHQYVDRLAEHFATDVIDRHACSND